MSNHNNSRNKIVKMNIKSVEKYRNEFEHIAKKNYQVLLCQLPQYYQKYFDSDIKAGFNGKLKQLVMRFNDIFEIQRKSQSKQIVLISKMYEFSNSKNNRINPKSISTLSRSQKKCLKCRKYQKKVGVESKQLLLKIERLESEKIAALKENELLRMQKAKMEEKMNEDERKEEAMRCKVTWEWQQNDDEWIPYNYEVSKELEKLQIGQSYIYRCNENGQEYEIKKDSKEFVVQKNTVSKLRRGGRRIMAKIAKSKKQIEYPSWWSIDCQQFSNYGTPKLIALDYKTNITAKQIYHKFHETVKNKTIVKIVSVENQLLFDKYWHEKQRLLILAQLNNVNKIKEKNLFHGTRTEDAMNKIIKEGFRKEFNETSVYGQGTYFARDARYSLQYAASDKNGISAIFCCAVICGESTKGDSNYKLKTWPKKSDGFMYDTLVDNISDPKIYVIHENARAYPLFVIFFS